LPPDEDSDPRLPGRRPARYWRRFHPAPRRLHPRGVGCSAVVARRCQGGVPLTDTIRYLTLVGEGMLELDRPEDALRYLDQALAIAATNPDLSFPMLAHAGKATALVRLNRRAEALRALDEALARARKDQIADYEAELLVQQGILHARGNERAEAVQNFEDAAGIAGRGRVYRIQASALMELAKEHRGSGDLAKAEDAAVQSLAAIRKVGDRYSIPHHLALL